MKQSLGFTKASIETLAGDLVTVKVKNNILLKQMTILQNHYKNYLSYLMKDKKSTMILIEGLKFKHKVMSYKVKRNQLNQNEMFQKINSIQSSNMEQEKTNRNLFNAMKGNNESLEAANKACEIVKRNLEYKLNSDNNLINDNKLCEMQQILF